MENDEALEDAPKLSASDDGDEHEPVESDVDEQDEDAGVSDEDAEEQPDEDSEADDQEEEETEEIEVDGKKYAVPKALKSAFMMQSDYTRKTQTVAEEKKALEQREKALEQQAEERKQFEEDRTEVAVLGRLLSQYDDIDWDKWGDDDPVAAQNAWRRKEMMKEQRSQAAERLREAETKQAETARRNYAHRVQETAAILKRDINGWSNAEAKAVTDYAIEQGFAQNELPYGDARAIKVLHKARLYDEIMKKQAKPASKKPPKIKPMSQVSKRASRPASSALPSDRDSDAEWLRKREAQVAKQRRA